MFLSKKSLQISKTWICHYKPESKKLSMEMKYRVRLSGKEKVLGAVNNKEGHADSLLGHERTHDY